VGNRAENLSSSGKRARADVESAVKKLSRNPQPKSGGQAWAPSLWTRCGKGGLISGFVNTVINR
jgi:hypothetical protein